MTSPPPVPRWFERRSVEQRRDYAERFHRLVEQGEDVDGEARFIDALADRHSVILDAGCGTGRVAAALSRCGHDTVGVDADPILIQRGRELYPDQRLAVHDLSGLSAEALATATLPATYDIVVVAGNVMLFVAAGTEADVVGNLAALLGPRGRLVVGFLTGDEGYTHDLLDRDAAAAGLTHEHRFATWQADRWHDQADWAVSVYRRS